MVGRTLAHYLVVEKIGAGGMGIVYRARDIQLERLVALKVVGENDQLDQQAQARLMREARTASGLNHANICTVYGAGVSGGVTYIAMELVEGRPLQAMVSGGGLPAETVIRYGIQIADALAHAHDHGIVHRDLKCANVMITPGGQLKVLDFGLAKREIHDDMHSLETLTQSGVVMGTVSYMAPEILQGQSADARSDLWAMGVMLYHALTGSLPFKGATPFQTISAIQRDSPPPLPAHVTADLAAIVQRLLAKQPGERYQRAGEVRAALETIQGGASGTRMVGVPRRRWLWAAAAAGVGALVWMGIQSRIQPQAPSGEPRLSDGGRPSTIKEANEYYERALQFAGTSPRHDPLQVRKNLEKALTLDPKFATARAHYAFTHMLFILQGDSADASWLYKAEEEARQALQDDPMCGAAHSVLAGTYFLRGRKEMIPREVAEALKGNPNDPAIHTWLVLYHWSNGDYLQAMRKSEQILARWPTFWPSRMNFADMLREQGDLAGAIRTQELILEQDPQSRIVLAARARTYIDSGDLAKARTALELIRVQDRRNYRVRMVWAQLLAKEGKKNAAMREMDTDVQAYGGNSFYGPLQVAEFYAVMGDTAKAFEWLDRAARLGDDREDWLRRDPLLASIRDEPRFEQVLASAAYRRKQRPDAPNAQ